MTKKKRVPADVMLAQILADPAVAARMNQDTAWRQYADELKRAEAPVVADLRAAGVAVNSVWDLGNSRKPRPKAVPILFEHFTRDYPPELREMIARALADRETRLRWNDLITLYRAETESRVKDGLAATIMSIVTPHLLDDVIALASDPTNGESRIFLVHGISRLRDPRAQEALTAFGSDPVLGPEARARLAVRRASAERALKRRREKQVH